MYLKRKVSIFLIIILLVTSFVPATIFASADSNQIGLNAQADNIQTPIEARESAITSINGNENAQDGLLDIKHQTYFWNNNDFADAFSAFLASDDVDLETRITRLVNDLKSAFSSLDLTMIETDARGFLSKMDVPLIFFLSVGFCILLLLVRIILSFLIKKIHVCTRKRKFRPERAS